MTLTTMLLALAAWLAVSCIIAWGLGRTADLGQLNAGNTEPAAIRERRARSDRRQSTDRRQQTDRRAATRPETDRRIMDRRLMQRRLAGDYGLAPA